MKLVLGGMCLTVAVAFCVGLFLGMARVAWDNSTGVNGVVAFFGFGLPTMLAGAGTLNLWEGYVKPLQRFGWMCTMASLIWAASLFYLLAGWTGLITSTTKVGFFDGVGLFLGFAVPMTILGGTGIYLLVERPAATK